MVCFDEHFVGFDSVVCDPATGEKLQRFVVFYESGEERARFVLPMKALGEMPTRWEIQAAAKEALRAFDRKARLRRKMA
jgi:hypothetical protein